MMCVLVVSPDQSLEQYLRRELSPAEFEILVSHPGPGVLDASRRARPEIAVIHQGHIRRQTAALEQAILRSVRPNVRIILVSSAPSTDDAELVEAGVFYYMSAAPPVRLPDVVRAAARSLRDEAGRRLRQGETR
jgi:ActR/RegA family two-component response regulator